MYQQPNHSYASADSLRRFSSNNPFRNQIDQRPVQPQNSGSSLSNSNKNRSPSKSSLGQSSITFENWIQKNKDLLALSSDEEEEDEAPINRDDDILNVYQSNGGTPLTSHNNSTSGTPRPPQFPRATRADSDTSIHYSNRTMQSNNPFASALNEPDSYVHRREPPAPPRRGSSGNTPPARPPKPPADSLPPPSYEEAAGREAARREYKREKGSSSSNDNNLAPPSRPHRSHSDSNGHGRERSRGHRSHHHSRKDAKPESQPPSSRTLKASSSLSRKKSPSKKTPEPVKAKNLDTIDKLDVTAFFGGGFHHDGPFDACTPHRNKNVKAAPVMAFPVDGPNNYIGGSGGNIDKNEQMDLAFGNYNEDRDDATYRRPGATMRTGRLSDDGPVTAGLKTNRVHDDPSSTIYTAKQNPSVTNFDSNLKAQPIHGSTTAGLGSTTFVDGAPAPKKAAQEAEQQMSGLNRKKSLVQRLRKKG